MRRYARCYVYWLSWLVASGAVHCIKSLVPIAMHVKSAERLLWMSCQMGRGDTEGRGSLQTTVCQEKKYAGCRRPVGNNVAKRRPNTKMLIIIIIKKEIQHFLRQILLSRASEKHGTTERKTSPMRPNLAHVFIETFVSHDTVGLV